MTAAMWYGRYRRRGLWAAWAVGTVGFAVLLGAKLNGEDRTLFLPGATSDGHYQIELECNACHAEPFAVQDSMQQACEGCHADALDAARDSHPKLKFTDPRNADRTALLDARYCVTCHVEHRPAATGPMGLTVPQDFCAVCHADVAEDRPTHAGASFASCASSGCHNFHDNRALYEDFLLKHGDQPPLLSDRSVDRRNFASIARFLSTYPAALYPLEPLNRAAADAPPASRAEGAMTDWADTSHAASGVNCTACHASGGAAWLDQPGYDACAGCHVNESRHFALGRHGMRSAKLAGIALPPMRVADARLPMKEAPTAEQVDCGSCHSAHRFDTVFAAVDACLGCHDDTHSNAYFGSPHEQTESDSVTCATCHMPRIEESYEFGAYVHVLVQHNQSANLRPNDGMLRDVCMRCHGLAFSLDALADPALIDNNFSGAPSVHVPSIDWARQRRGASERQRVERSSSADSVRETSSFIPSP